MPSPKVEVIDLKEANNLSILLNSSINFSFRLSDALVSLNYEISFLFNYFQKNFGKENMTFIIC